VIAPLAATIVEKRFPEGDQFVFVRSDGRAIQAEFVDPDSDARHRRARMRAASGLTLHRSEADGDVRPKLVTLSADVASHRSSRWLRRSGKPCASVWAQEDARRRFLGKIRGGTQRCPFRAGWTAESGLP
jgi:hypothetical protein